MDLITLLLSSYALSLDTWTIPRWKPNIAHKHFSMACKILKLLVGTMSSTLPLAWKVAILLEIKQTKEWGGDVVKTTIFYMKKNDK